jgi:pimeloyl-ACP methyl ester carboxylesterase
MLKKPCLGIKRLRPVPDELQIRVYGDASLPTLVYLPGLHGDWTLITGFREALHGRVRFVEFTYPRTLVWSIDDYATAIEKALVSHGITHGWLLGESFGSQPAWALVGKSSSPPVERGASLRQGPAISTPATPSFKADGLILAAGFVKHPLPYGPLILRRIGNLRPHILFRLTMRVFAWYSRLCHRLTPEARTDLDEFLARRTALDRRAMGQRLLLIHQYDPRPIARACRVPVHYLAGFFDPLVPWPVVRRWLRKNCPGYRGGKTILLADHTLLAGSPVRAAAQVLRWMGNPARP